MQVTHVLLTRSRLCPRASPGSSLHLHVLSTPPAFVLSQDQTLRERLACHPIHKWTGVTVLGKLSHPYCLVAAYTMRHTSDSTGYSVKPCASPASRRHRVEPLDTTGTLSSLGRTCC